MKGKEEGNSTNQNIVKHESLVAWLVIHNIKSTGKTKWWRQQRKDRRIDRPSKRKCLTEENIQKGQERAILSIQHPLFSVRKTDRDGQSCVACRPSFSLPDGWMNEKDKTNFSLNCPALRIVNNDLSFSLRVTETNPRVKGWQDSCRRLLSSHRLGFLFPERF